MNLLEAISSVISEHGARIEFSPVVDKPESFIGGLRVRVTYPSHASNIYLLKDQIEGDKASRGLVEILLSDFECTKPDSEDEPT